ncbi:MAG: chondroitinase-B domain-containing protein [Bacteroidia bacterium]
MNILLKRLAIVCAVTAQITTVLLAKNLSVHSVAGFYEAEKASQPGDTITWVSGTREDVIFTISKNGLTVMAEKPGATIFTGKSSVQITADEGTFSGFQFAEGEIEGDILTISGSHNLITELNFTRYQSHYYLNTLPSATYNTIQNCSFEKKPLAPPGQEGNSVVQIQAHKDFPGHNTVRYCAFREHTAPPGAGGDYGIEALRIGYSYQGEFDSKTVVEYCFFYRCNGDGEVISNKARNNIFRYNTFFDNGPSHLTLRHGSDAIVHGNYFIQGAGIRIKEGQNYAVYDNYFETGDYFAINLQNYKVDPLDSVIISRNTFIGGGEIRLGGIGKFPPQHVTFIRNGFTNPIEEIFTDPVGSEIFKRNRTGTPAKKYPSKKNISAHSGNCGPSYKFDEVFIP